MSMGRGFTDHGRLLVCRVGAKLCALPLRDVVETMRPLPLERLPNMPTFVRGVSLIRGRPTPVIDARLVLGESEAVDSSARRCVTLSLGERHVALLVDAVTGIRSVGSTELEQLPLVLRDAQPEVEALGILDAELLLVLQHARLLSNEQLAYLEAKDA
jgi:purine-binding chemotaxis protein CheW